MFSKMDGLNIADGRLNPIFTIREEPGFLPTTAVVRRDGAVLAVARFSTRADAERWLNTLFPDALESG